MNKPKKKAESNIDFKAQQLDENSEIYINLLCDRYKHRGITTKVKSDAAAQSRKNEAASKAAAQISVNTGEIFANDEKYKHGNFQGVSYMTSDDFAHYYKDRRDFNTSRATRRTEGEYEEIAKKAQEKKAKEDSVPPKKALWLAIVYELKTRAKKIKDKLNAEGLKEFSESWFPRDDEENRREGEKSRFPLRIVPAFVVITISLLLIVSGSVMVSHAEIDVSKLENKIVRLERERDALDAELNTRIDLMEIRKWAIGEGMVGREYLNSKYIELENDEMTEKIEKERKPSLIRRFLEAVGIINSED